MFHNNYYSKLPIMDYYIFMEPEKVIGLNFLKKTELSIPFIREISKKIHEKLMVLLDEKIKPFFSEKEIEELAKEANFVQRKSKLTGQIFFELIVFNREHLKSESLDDFSAKLLTDYSVNISRQGIHERFNKYAVSFLEMCLEKLIKEQIKEKNNIETIKGIKRILIKDSVCFQVDPSLFDAFPGCGGNSSKAVVRIQFEYDFLSGKITDLTLNAFTDQDADNSKQTLELIMKKDLLIRDLAYMGLDVLHGISNAFAFFLCRLNPTVKVFEKKRNKLVEINFKKIYKYMKKANIQILEKEVYLSSAKKLPVRLIINMLPKNVVDERIRKAEYNNKKKGRNKLSRQFKDRARFNMFITNSSPEQIPMENAWTLYRLRWQIELLFKIWKSICSIDKVKKANIARLKCYIYSKLILIVMSWCLIHKIGNMITVAIGESLSYYKAFKTLLRVKLNEFKQVALSEKAHMSKFIENLYFICINKHLLESKGKESAPLEMLSSCSTT